MHFIILGEGNFCHPVGEKNVFMIIVTLVPEVYF
jgi:hypothetical protein